VEVGSRSRGTSYELGYYEPWLDAKHTSLSASVYNKLIYRFTSNAWGGSGSGTTDSDYDERRQGASLTLARPFSRTNKGFLTLRSESVDTRLDQLAPGDPGYDTRNLLSQDGTVTSGTFRFTSNTRDSELDPVLGTYRSYALEVGQSDFTSQGDKSGNSIFGKYSVDFRKYFSKGGFREDLNEKRRTIAVRLMVGSLTGNVPFFEQYFLGGAESLRGYREDRFWGRNMVLLNTEYRFPVTSGLTGVGFVDVGDAWGAIPDYLDVGNAFGESLLQHAGFDPNFGYGFGIRVRTPIGPIRLDYGFGSEGSRAHFSLGHAF
jgi:outer membrane protein insertion porin family